VGVSTILSFEAGQRAPMRANLAALERALSDAGVIFLEGDMNSGRGLKLKKSTEALRDILLIAALKEPLEKREQRARTRVAQFCDDARAFYDGFYGKSADNADRVRSDRGKLRDRVDEEIQRRARLRLDDQPTRFLEPISDFLNDD
jgi:hypothetical protein